MDSESLCAPSAVGVALLGDAVWSAGAAVPARRIAVIGTCKNAGKTTALLALLASTSARGLSAGVVSIGVDGEAHDAFLDFAKPQIWLDKGAHFVTALPFALAAGRSIEVLRQLPFATALGPTVVGVVRHRCPLQLTGIGHRAHLQIAVTELLHRADRVVIDGAYHRQAAAHPAVADALVVAVGAMAGPTTQAAWRASLPTVRALLAPLRSESGYSDADHSFHPVKAALTDALIAAHPATHRFVVRDSSRILLTAAGWQMLDRRQALVEVLAAVPVRAIVGNPFRADATAAGATDSSTANSHGFVDAVAQYLGQLTGVDMPVIDVVGGWRGQDWR